MLYRGLADMTSALSNRIDAPTDPGQSILPFRRSELTSMRVLPSSLARILGVSKQAVSGWIKDGKITLGSDGRVDPITATDQYLRNTDPARIRVRVLRDMRSTHAELIERAERAESALIAARAATADTTSAALFRLADDHAHRVALLQSTIVDGFDELARARGRGYLADALESMIDAIFYPESALEDGCEASTPPVLRTDDPPLREDAP